jgi:GNAT superfamily N-acetyltransferase
MGYTVLRQERSDITYDRASGTRRVVVARLDDRSERIVGTVQLDPEMPPNQQHRAAVAKLLVHPAARRRGIGRALMIAAPVTERDGRIC